MNYYGCAVSEGIAIGKVFRYQPFQPLVEEKKINEVDVETNLILYKDICNRSKVKLNAIIKSLEIKDESKSKIFKAHIEILDDIVLTEDIISSIKDKKHSPDWAVYSIFEKYINILEKTENKLIRERVADLVDVRNRLLKEWYHVDNNSLNNLNEPIILVAHDLLPSDTATLDKNNVLAIINEIGGNTSHTAILARSFSIPAILGVQEAMSIFEEGELLIVDATTGQIISKPSERTLEDYKIKKKEYYSGIESLKRYLGEPTCSKDGTHIDLGVNIGGIDEELDRYQQYTDMIGLFRTEFLYMNSKQLPTEEEQYSAYKKVLQIYGNKPVTLRTLDVGGDKTMSCMQLEKEDNPFLGKRALRLCFDHIDLFKTQLRAALRASVYGNLWLMFPMVSSLDDIRKAKTIIEEVKQELIISELPFSDTIKIGIMIETPSIAIMAEKVAGEVDFASIGTNDLCQYLMAVDRTNPNVSCYYQNYHPALFITIKQVAEMFSNVGKPVSICGEIAGDALVAPILLGLGIRKLSMNFSSVAKVKKAISERTIDQMKDDALRILGMDTSSEIEQYLRGYRKPQ